jgi:hypothetical protein
VAGSTLSTAVQQGQATSKGSGDDFAIAKIVSLRGELPKLGKLEQRCKRTRTGTVWVPGAPTHIVIQKGVSEPAFSSAGE